MKELNSYEIINILSEYLNLEKVGSYYKALCPFHKENTPSFYVTPSKNAFHCFGCNAHGNLQTLLKEFLPQEEIEKLNINFDRISDIKLNYNSKKVSKDYNYNKILESLENIVPDLSLVEKDLHFTNFNLIRDYLENRKIDINIAQDYGLQAVNYGNLGVYIPVYFKHNDKIKITEAQVRFVEDVKPKIKGIPGSRKIFFFGFFNKEGLNLDKNTDKLLITESWGNTLSYVSATKKRNIIASMGSFITNNQLENLQVNILRLSNLKELIIIPDAGKFNSWKKEARKLGESLNKTTYIFNIRKALKSINFEGYSDNLDFDLNDILKKNNKINITKLIEDYKELVWENKQEYLLKNINKRKNYSKKKSFAWR